MYVYVCVKNIFNHDLPGNVRRPFGGTLSRAHDRRVDDNIITHFQHIFFTARYDLTGTPTRTTAGSITQQYGRVALHISPTRESEAQAV